MKRLQSVMRLGLGLSLSFLLGAGLKAQTYEETGAKLSKEEQRGRDLWFKATAGNKWHHSYVLQQRYGAPLDFYRTMGTATRGRRRKATTSPVADEEETNEAPSRPREPANGFSSVALGRCPLCGSDVVDQPKSYGCSGWKQGCKFAIWKTIAGKKISVKTAEALLKSGKSPLLRGFKSKAGNTFDAQLKLDGGEVRFDFEGGDRRGRSPKGRLRR